MESEQQALEIANSVEYGLAAAIFTENLSSAYRIADQVESGMVHINMARQARPICRLGA